jgi:acyl CoA:acetate/3-ketoacid CoA transferase beta subunit
VLVERGMLEVRDEGLVIVGLAPGVSALELQSDVAAALLIAPEVEEMMLNEAAGDDIPAAP